MPRRRPPSRSLRKPPLRIQDILVWADAFRARFGRWPHLYDGPVDGVADQTWAGADQALRMGNRGLPGGSTLALLLLARRRRRHWHRPSDLTVRSILRWADAFRARTGNWPSGKLRSAIPEAPDGTTWVAVELALARGTRGLSGGSSLARLLDAHRGIRNRMAVPALTAAEVLAWADEHRARTGRWPKYKDGAVAAATGETWSAVDTALLRGKRGLPGGDSLARFLARHCGIRNRAELPRLTVAQIRRWAKSFRQRVGRWPHTNSGPVADAPGETWAGIHQALSAGRRGLPGGSSLAEAIEGR